LGSRRRGDVAYLSGRRQQTGDLFEAVHEVLSDETSARIIVNTAVDVLAMSNPAIGTVVGAYKVSKTVYEVAEKANEAYAKTHDPNAAVAAASQEIAHVAIVTARDQAVGRLVDVGWCSMKSSAGIKTSEIQDRILTSAVKNTLSEVMPK